MTRFGNFEWDDEKDDLNFKKHSFYLSEAILLFNDPYAMEIEAAPDAKTGEKRKMIIGQVGKTVLSCIYVERGSRIRLISCYPRTGRLRNDYRKNRLS